MPIVFDARDPKAVQQQPRTQHQLFQNMHQTDIQSLDAKLAKEKEDRIKLLLQKYPQYRGKVSIV